MITIRTARREDLDELSEVFRSASLSNEGDRENLLANPELLELSDQAIVEERVRLAEIDGRTVGFATSAREGPTVELEDLFVHPDWTRRGVATRLIADLVESSRAAGASTVAVTANHHAMAFYLSVGFRGTAKVETAFEPGTRMYLHLSVASVSDAPSGNPEAGRGA
jgi:N-acetylglutamate synthase-like GNAT family acetyltransferase